MKKRASVTQKQIAERANVSQTVVSLALNNSYDVTLSEETRQRVLDVAAELGYVPQAAAKALVQGQSTNIGLVLIRPHYQVFRDPFIPNIITGISGVVRSYGYRLVVEHIDNLNNLNTIPNMLKGREVAGMVLSSYEGLEHIITPLVADDYPMVFLDQAPEHCYGALINHAEGVKLAAEHLVSLGHRYVACITFGPIGPHVNNRLQAFLDTFARAGIVITSEYILQGHYDPESSYEIMQDILTLDPRPTALFGMNDLMALGAMRAIHEAGLRIPQDIAVVGYDDMRFAAFTNPTLTTVRAPEVEVGRLAGEMLIKLISGERVDKRHVNLNCELMVRGSCGAR